MQIGRRTFDERASHGCIQDFKKDASEVDFRRQDSKARGHRRVESLEKKQGA